MQKVAAAFDITISALIDPKTSVSYRSARSLEGLSMVNEVQVPYLSPGENLAALRDENRRLKEQIAEMAKELEKRGEMNSDLLEILKSLAKGEK